MSEQECRSKKNHPLEACGPQCVYFDQVCEECEAPLNDHEDGCSVGDANARADSVTVRRIRL